MAKQQADKADLKTIAKQMGLTEIDTIEAVDDLADDIILSMYRDADPVRKAQIERVWKEWHPGAVFEDDGLPIAATLLMGPPGHGKTTSFKQASRKVAKALGMRYLENADLDSVPVTEITENDMVFVSQETAGMLSSLEIGGVPTKELNEEGRAVMGRLLSGRWHKLEKAGGGVLLLDDFLNSSPTVQNTGLSLTEEKRFGDVNFHNKVIGLTGNLGQALDGTYTTPLGSALANRVKIFFTQDNLTNFVNRTQSNPVFRDELGDIGVSGFLQRMDTYFAQLPQPKSAAGFVSPRSWEKFIIEGRRVINKFGGRGAGAINALPKLRRISSALLGAEASDQLMTYMRSMLDLADPLARDLIKGGKLDEETLGKRFKNGFSSSEQHFAYQFALALADYTSLKVIEDGASKMDEAIKRFAKGALVMEGPAFAFALEALKERLSRRVEELSEVTMVQDIKNRKIHDLKLDAKVKIGNLIAETPGFTASHREVMLPVLSNSDKQRLEGGDNRPSRARKR